jgi:hypothetical protein
MMARSLEDGPWEGFAEQPPEKILKSQFGPLQTHRSPYLLEISLLMCSAVPTLGPDVRLTGCVPIRERTSDGRGDNSTERRTTLDAHTC